MQLQLTKPELEKFINEQVEAGHFPSPQAAVEAAVEQMMHNRVDSELTDEDAEEIEKSEAELDRGEFVEFDSLASEMRKKYCGR